MIKVDKKNKIILEIDDNIFLKILTKDDITSDYINWMNDYDIVKEETFAPILYLICN